MPITINILKVHDVTGEPFLDSGTTLSVTPTASFVQAPIVLPSLNFSTRGIWKIVILNKDSANYDVRIGTSLTALDNLEYSFVEGVKSIQGLITVEAKVFIKTA
jgi:hypothetical protein